MAESVRTMIQTDLKLKFIFKARNTFIILPAVSSLTHKKVRASSKWLLVSFQ